MDVLKQLRKNVNAKATLAEKQQKEQKKNRLGGKNRIRESSTGGPLYGRQYTHEERTGVLQDLEETLVSEIDEAATGDDRPVFDLVDLMARWSDLLQDEGLPPHPDPFGKSGMSFATRLCKRNDLKIRTPISKSSLPASDTLRSIRVAWDLFRDVHARATRACAELEAIGTRAEICFLNGDETFIKDRIESLRVIVPEDVATSNIPPQLRNSTTTGKNEKGGGSLLIWLSSDANFIPSPTAVDALPAKGNHRENMKNAISSCPIGGNCYPCGNYSTGTSWLCREIFRESLLAIRKKRDEMEKRTGIRKVLIIFTDKHTIHDVDLPQPGFVQNKLEAHDIFYFCLPGYLTWIVQPVDVCGIIRSIKTEMRRHRWEKPFQHKQFWEMYAENAKRYSNFEEFHRLGFHADEIVEADLSSRIRGVFEACR